MSLNKESCLIVAGEKSGEDHAMTFLPDLIKLRPECEFYGVGGKNLEKLGVKLEYHLKDFSGIGFSEVISKIPFYYRAADHLVSLVKEKNTKTAILIDFQGFNLKVAQRLKKLGVNVLYYVAPQAWVWKPWRAKVLEQNVHTLFTILPFEKEWFQNRGVSKVKGVIHPLMLEYKKELSQVIEKKYFQEKNERKARILLLPGSRNTEVSKLMPLYEKGIKLFEEESIPFELGIVTSESVSSDNYITELDIRMKWDSKDLAEALKWGDVCIAASGTVTLATGLFKLPTIVCYKVSYVTEFIVEHFIPYDGPVSLTNIIHENRMIFPELLQYQADRYQINKYLKRWLRNEEEYQSIVNTLDSTKTKLTGDSFDVPEYMASVIEESH